MARVEVTADEDDDDDECRHGTSEVEVEVQRHAPRVARRNIFSGKRRRESVCVVSAGGAGTLGSEDKRTIWTEEGGGGDVRERVRDREEFKTSSE